MLKRPKDIENLKNEINSIDAELIRYFGIVAVTSASNDRLLRIPKSLVVN